MPTRKARGQATELLMARYMRDNGYPNAYAVRGPGTDLGGLPWPWEIKARRELDLPGHMRQAMGRDGPWHPLTVRPDGMGPSTMDLWPTIFPLHEALSLLTYWWVDTLDEPIGRPGPTKQAPREPDRG